MPSSASTFPAFPTPVDALAAAESGARPGVAHFHVVPFRRTADGKIVPGTAVEVTNGDIAWRWARAAAFDHENVGAAAFSGEDIVAHGVLLTSFGEVNLDALRH